MREKYPQTSNYHPTRLNQMHICKISEAKDGFGILIVRLYIAKCANGDRQAWPSLKKIVKNCKISKPTVTKALGELEEKKWLKKIIQKRPNSEYANTIYILNNPPVSLPKEGVVK